jgi:hypothetical protein
VLESHERASTSPTIVPVTVGVLMLGFCRRTPLGRTLSWNNSVTERR